MWKFILPLTVSHKHQSKLLFRPFIIFAANKFILNTLFSLLIFLHFQFFKLSVVQPSLASPVCSPSLWQLFLSRLCPTTPCVCLLFPWILSIALLLGTTRPPLAPSLWLAVSLPFHLVAASLAQVHPTNWSQMKNKKVTVSRTIVLKCNLLIHRITREFMILLPHRWCWGEGIY